MRIGKAEIGLRLVVEPEKCTGCRLCETACTFAHEGNFGSRTARVRVVKLEDKGIDYPVICQRCVRPACVSACPTGAMTQDSETGVVTVASSICTWCGRCVEACPFGAVNLHPVRRTPLVCDLCGGSPQCAKQCPTGAIVLEPSDQEVHTKRLESASQAKRDAFAERMCRKMLEKWRNR